MNIKICGVITARTPNELKNMLLKAERLKVDLAEIRIDYWKREMNSQGVRKLSALPLIATVRPIWEGGVFDRGEEERKFLLLSAADAGFDYVDIELRTEGLNKMVEEVRRAGSKPIVSSHNFNFTPDADELYRIFLEELKVGAEICKIVTMAKSFRDNITCFKSLEKMTATGRSICFCMGRYGTPSRILAPLFDSAFTYASIQHGKESAPGQLTVEELRAAYRIMGV
ncbi:MAG: type I 3-dehydroquinate dehydratase [Candidatus Bathyarchaeia archaeon]